MKQMILFAALLLCFSSATRAQAKEAPWKASLVRNLASEFSLPEDLSRKAVNLKESYFRQIQAYSMPHVETQMGRDAQRKAIAKVREEELAGMKALFKDEARAKKVSDYLEPRIVMSATAPPRPR